MNNLIVSIIVPIYNASLHLRECLTSIKNQTYTNIQVILINDGSTDESFSIAEEFTKYDNRFELINKENKGVASARKAGLSRVKGYYCIHCDADDFFTNDAIEIMVDYAINNNADMVVSDYFNLVNNKKILVAHLKEYQGIDFLKALLTGEYHSSLCNKLIKTDLCKPHYFEDDVNFMEDKLFITNILLKNKALICYSKKPAYFYRFVTNSYTNKISVNSVKNSIYVTDKICTQIDGVVSSKLIRYLINYNKLFVVLSSDLSQDYRKPDTLEKILSDNAFSIRHRFVLWAVKNNIRWPIKMYKFLQNYKTRF